MAVELAQGVVSDLQTYLQAHLSAKITAINTQYSDDIILTDIADWYTTPQQLKGIPNFPIIIILAGHTDVFQFQETWTDSGIEVTIGVIVMDPNNADLSQRAYRYTLAIWLCLVDAYFSSGLSWRLFGNPSIDHSPIYSNGSSFLADGRVNASFRKHEA